MENVLDFRGVPVVSIVIVNWNTKDDLRQCLHSVEENLKGVLFEGIVVDNHSKDGSGEMVKKDYPRWTFIENEENMGFARAANAGIRKSGGTYVLLLNPDIVVKPYSIRRLTDFMERKPEAGGVGGRLLSPQGMIQWK